MMQILEFRERLRAIYQKFQMYIDPVAKFIVAMITFMVINQVIGYDTRFDKFYVVLLLSLLCAFTPSSILVLAAMVLTLAHVYSVAKLLSFLLIVIFIVLYCLFVRFTPKFGYVVVGIPILYALHIPYVFPIVLGLIATPLTILPASCGVIVYYVVSIIQQEVEATANIKEIKDILPLYVNVIDDLIQNKEMIFTMIVFAIVITLVYIIRRQKIEYAFEISIAAGAVANIIAFLIVFLRVNQPKQIGGMILGTILSAAIAEIIQFFRRVLDYTAVENVQFEDDDYYYYVKAVPKINVSMPNMKVKRINVQKASEDMPEEDEDIENDDMDMPPRQLDRRTIDSRMRNARTQQTVSSKRYE